MLFSTRLLSYFAKPNFIVHDEWFDNDFKKTKLNFKNKKSPFIENIAKNKLKFNIKKKIIYSLTIFGFVIILGLLLFFISQ